ncbi:MAG: hypothetical protein UV78_C0077G0003 [Parcubacteria group bacterium GW2011_GWA2_43_17]|nr:MAG: hypothetical protein UV78_C0077G0003 [Parcubacteria group bacterium GW2011_GWA2_43_17]
MGINISFRTAVIPAKSTSGTICSTLLFFPLTNMAFITQTLTNRPQNTTVPIKKILNLLYLLNQTAGQASAIQIQIGNIASQELYRTAAP